MDDTKNAVNTFVSHDGNDEFDIYDVGNNDGLESYGITDAENSNKDHCCVKEKKYKVFKPKSILVNFFLKHMVDYIV